MNRCETCRHWKPTDGKAPDGKPLGECWPLREAIDIDVDGGCGGEGCAWPYVDTVATPPDFGCPLWEPRDPQPAQPPSWKLI